MLDPYPDPGGEIKCGSCGTLTFLKAAPSLIDLGAFVGEVDVVLVCALLHQHVEEAEGGDERTDDRVGH